MAAVLDGHGEILTLATFFHRTDAILKSTVIHILASKRAIR